MLFHFCMIIDHVNDVDFMKWAKLFSFSSIKCIRGKLLEKPAN